MSRFKRFAHSLASGYVLLGANMLYTLASVPLALHYLSKAEFGLWALVTQMAGYVALVDFGLSASASRVLIDHKDNRASGSYGGMVQTGALVGLTQGTLVMLVGIAVALFLGPALRVEESLQDEFSWLMIGQCVLVGFGFITRILNHMLTAHQRYDITNYTQAILFVVAFVVMWFCLAHGVGVKSVLWAQAAGLLVVTGVNFWGCVRLDFLPRRGEWGRPTWSAFRELFAFGRDFFLFAVGSQLINASQVLLLTRFQGLETAAVWSICTRLYVVMCQVIYRIFDYSSGALAEMIVRGEHARLRGRFREIVSLSVSLSVAGGVVLAVCNSTFITWWTSGRINALQLFATDIKEPMVLAGKISYQADPVSGFIWTQMTPQGRAELAAALTDRPVEEIIKNRLASELNRVIHGENLYDANRFYGAALSADTRALITADKGKNMIKLNRYLLEDAYPTELASSRKVRWIPFNDLLLGVWLVLCVVINAHTGLVGQTKNFAALRFLPFLEGVAFVGLSVLTFRIGGMTAMLLTSIACGIIFRLPYGLYRSRRYLAVTNKEIAGWHRPVIPLVLVLSPVGVVLLWLSQELSVFPRLCVLAGAVAVAAVVSLLLFGFSPGVRTEIMLRSPAWFRQLLLRLGFDRGGSDF